MYFSLFYKGFLWYNYKNMFLPTRLFPLDDFRALGGGRFVWFHNIESGDISPKVNQIPWVRDHLSGLMAEIAAPENIEPARVMTLLNEIRGKRWSARNPEFENSALYVFALQSGLHMLGYGTQVGVIDGLWGPKTSSGLRAFQQAYNAAHPEEAITVDGLPGPESVGAVLRELGDTSSGGVPAVPAGTTVPRPVAAPAVRTTAPIPPTRSVPDTGRTTRPPEQPPRRNTPLASAPPRQAGGDDTPDPVRHDPAAPEQRFIPPGGSGAPDRAPSAPRGGMGIDDLPVLPGVHDDLHTAFGPYNAPQYPPRTPTDWVQAFGALPTLEGGRAFLASHQAAMEDFEVVAAAMDFRFTAPFVNMGVSNPASIVNQIGNFQAQMFGIMQTFIPRMKGTLTDYGRIDATYYLNDLPSGDFRYDVEKVMYVFERERDVLQVRDPAEVLVPRHQRRARPGLTPESVGRELESVAAVRGITRAPDGDWGLSLSDLDFGALSRPERRIDITTGQGEGIENVVRENATTFRVETGGTNPKNDQYEIRMEGHIAEQGVYRNGDLVQRRFPVFSRIPRQEYAADDVLRIGRYTLTPEERDYPLLEQIHYSPRNAAGINQSTIGESYASCSGLLSAFEGETPLENVGASTVIPRLPGATIMHLNQIIPFLNQVLAGSVRIGGQRFTFDGDVLENTRGETVHARLPHRSRSQILIRRSAILEMGAYLKARGFLVEQNGQYALAAGRDGQSAIVQSMSEELY